MKLLIVCNDKIITRLIRFIASVRFHSPETIVVIIPFNDSFELCREVSKIFSIDVIEEQIDKIDLFGRRMFDDNIPQQPYPYMLGKLRKLSIFMMSEPVVYIDVDTIITSDFNWITQSLNAINNSGFGYFVKSPDWVYNDTEIAKEYRSRSHLFSSGFFFKGQGCPSFDEISDVLLNQKQLYHSVRHHGVVDQPLLNFLIDALRFDKVHNLQAMSGVSYCVTPHAETNITANWTAKNRNQCVPFIHAAGHYKEDISCKFIFDAMLLNGLETIKRKNRDLFIKIMNVNWE